MFRAEAIEILTPLGRAAAVRDSGQAG